MRLFELPESMQKAIKAGDAGTVADKLQKSFKNWSPAQCYEQAIKLIQKHD